MIRYKLTKDDKQIIGTSDEIGRYFNCSKQYVVSCFCYGIRMYGYDVERYEAKQRWLEFTDSEGHIVFEGTYADVADYFGINKRSAGQIPVKYKNGIYRGLHFNRTWKWVRIHDF